MARPGARALWGGLGRSGVVLWGALAFSYDLGRSGPFWNVLGRSGALWGALGRSGALWGALGCSGALWGVQRHGVCGIYSTSGITCQFVLVFAIHFGGAPK